MKKDFSLQKNLFLINKRIALFHILIFILFAIQIFHRLSKGGDSWQSADWLINYSNGFIRRGLIGQILFLLASLLSVNPIWILTFFQISLIIFLLFYSNILFQHLWDSLDLTVRKFTWVIILCPVSIGFLIQNPSGNFRKELMGILFSIFFTVKLFQFRIWNKFRILLFIFFFLLICLSWEPNISFLPLSLFIVNNLQNSRKTILVVKFTIIAVSCLVATFSWIYRGNGNSSGVICRSIQIFDVAPSICDGAISATSWNLEDFLFGSTMFHPLRAIGFLFLVSPWFIFLAACFWSIIRTKIFLLFSIVIANLVFNVLAADTGRSYFMTYSILLCVCLIQLKILDYERYQFSYLKISFFSNRNFYLLIFLSFAVWVPYGGESWRGLIPFLWLGNFISAK